MVSNVAVCGDLSWKKAIIFSCSGFSSSDKAACHIFVPDYSSSHSHPRPKWALNCFTATLFWPYFHSNVQKTKRWLSLAAGWKTGLSWSDWILPAGCCAWVCTCVREIEAFLSVCKNLPFSFQFLVADCWWQWSFLFLLMYPPNLQQAYFLIIDTRQRTVLYYGSLLFVYQHQFLLVKLNG